MADIILHGVNSIADQSNPLAGTRATFKARGVKPMPEKIGNNKTKASGGFRASRSKTTKIKIVFFPFKVVYGESATYNNFSDYITLQKILNYEYVYLESVGFSRALTSTTDVWDALLPIALELMEEEDSADFTNGTDVLSYTFRSRFKVNLGTL